MTQVYSVAGLLRDGDSLVSRPPFRMPHHSASNEGLVGGGPSLRLGEVSLAHLGVLVLDEAPQFRSSALQMLREPVETGEVTVVRARRTVRFPSRFQLVLIANPCPCGNLGRDAGVCRCTLAEVTGYWRRVGGALLDRIDIRVPVAPVPAEELLRGTSESTLSVRERVITAIERQRQRLQSTGLRRNSEIPAGLINRVCLPDAVATTTLAAAARRMGLSSRAVHSVMRTARTIADLAGMEAVGQPHVLEALQHRRYGDGDIYWR